MSDIFGPPGKVFCPFHEEQTPSAMLYEDGGLHCFGCERHAYSRRDLIRQIYFDDEPFVIGMALAAALCKAEGYGYTTSGAAPAPKAGASPAAIQAMTVFTDIASRNLADRDDLVLEIQRTRGVQDPVGMHLGLASRMLIAPVKRQLQDRGMAEDEADHALYEAGLTWEQGRYRLGYRLVIPEIRHDKTVYYQARALLPDETKYLNPSLPKPIFGLESLYKDNPLVFIGEGPFDVLPIIEAGGSALAILGSHSGEKLAQHLEKRTVVVGFDRDPTGLERGAQLAAGLREIGISATHIPPPSPHKDYSEWISHEGLKTVLSAVTWELP